jgi:ribosomal protein S18 acetylase RimI-like enzyme
MVIRIRTAVEADYEDVNKVFSGELAHHVALLPERFQQADPVMPRDWYRDVLAAANKTLFVAEADGNVAGLVLLVESVSQDDPIYRPRHYLYVDELAVLAEYRRQGIGRRLMTAAENLAVERGISTIELNVWENNALARSFYEGLGYHTIRRRLSRHLP